jgi:hypothetical protein
MPSEIPLRHEAPEVPVRSEATAQIVRIARFGVGCTLALALFLVIDRRGPPVTESLMTALAYAIAAQVVVAVAALAFMGLWKK